MHRNLYRYKVFLIPNGSDIENLEVITTLTCIIYIATTTTIRPIGLVNYSNNRRRMYKFKYPYTIRNESVYYV